MFHINLYLSNLSAREQAALRSLFSFVLQPNYCFPQIILGAQHNGKQSCKTVTENIKTKGWKKAVLVLKNHGGDHRKLWGSAP